MYQRLLFSFFISCLLMFALTSASLPQGQDIGAAVKSIERAIASNNATELAAFLSNEVEITINQKEELYPRKQAEFVIKEFFLSNPVQFFRILHQGNSSDTHYAVGEYVSSRGRYDTNIFIKRTSKGYVVEQLRFERAK